jgi:hypothetical protein
VADYRSMFDRDFIGVWDLQGRDVVVEIASVKAGELVSQGNKKSKKPILHFKGREKGMVVNKTNAHVIAAMYGNDTDKWVGQRITIFPTTTTFGRTELECIRVRPGIPKGKTSAAPEGVPVGGPVPHDPETGEVREPGSEG